MNSQVNTSIMIMLYHSNDYAIFRNGNDKYVVLAGVSITHDPNCMYISANNIIIII